MTTTHAPVTYRGSDLGSVFQGGELIYLGSPYTSPDPLVMQERYEQVLWVTSQLLKARMTVYSPIVHCHDMAVRHVMPRDFDFWERLDKSMIDHCKTLFWLDIPGARESRGVRAEIDYAQAKGLLIWRVSLISQGEAEMMTLDIEPDLGQFT